MTEMMSVTELLNLILGVTLAIASTIIFNLGMIFQKKGAEEIGEITLSNAKSFVNLVKSKIWLLGFILGIAGGLPYAIALQLIGVAIVQPLQGVGILVIVIFAIKWFNEKLETLEKIGAIFLIISPLIITLGNVGPVQVSIFDLAIINPLIIFYIIFITLIAITFVLYKVLPKGTALIVATTAGLFFGIGAISFQLGVNGLLTPLFTGATINWVLGPFGLLFVMLGNLFATFYVQIAYQKGHAAQVVPIINVGNLIIPIFGGVLIFGQVINNLFFFIPGVIVMFIGVSLLARVQGEIQKEEKQEDKDGK